MAVIGNINQEYMTPVNVAYQSLNNSSPTQYTLASFSIPTAGIWKVSFDARMGWCSFTRFCRCNLQCPSGGSSNWRLTLENLTQRACNGNITLAHNWTIDVKTGNSFSLSINLCIVNYDSGSSTLFHQNDGNGYTVLHAEKIATTSTGGSGIAAIGI